MTTRTFKTLLAGTVIAAMTVVSVASAEAGPRRYHGGNNNGAAFAALAIGVIGMTAAIAASQQRQTYYQGYYEPQPRYGYGYQQPQPYYQERQTYYQQGYPVYHGYHRHDPNARQQPYGFVYQ